MSEKSFNQVFAERLKHYMELCEMTQEDLAKRLGVGQTSVSNWCTGLKTPRMDKVDAMCRIFHCARADLINEDRSGLIYADEQSLLDKYERLNPIGRDKLHDRADELIQLGYTIDHPPLMVAEDQLRYGQ